MKGLLKFITCGSVDDGKSTLIGHILYDASYRQRGLCIPVINGRGFEVLVSSETELKQFLQEYEQTDESSQADFFAKWVKFDTNLKVVFPKS